MSSLIVYGATGRMGQRIISLATASGKFSEVIGVSDQPSGDIKPLSALDELGNERIAAMIDFSAPEGLSVALDACMKNGWPLVIGTTGFTDFQLSQIKDAAESIAVMRSANMSVGINVLASLLKSASATVPESFDVDIFEIHHKHKKDAPSGTARLLGDVVLDNRKIEEKDTFDVSGPRNAGELRFQVQRTGNVVGDHSVIFTSDEERIELKHTAFSRDVFARGAIHAATWLSTQPKGLYDMNDVLGA